MPRLNRKQARKNTNSVRVMNLSKKVRESEVIVEALKKENFQIHGFVLYTVLTIIERRLLSE